MNELFQYNSAATNVNIDNALDAVLSKFNDINYIIDYIDEASSRKFRQYADTIAPNMVYAYEQEFKRDFVAFEGNQDKISQVREDTYETIIKQLCSRFNLRWNAPDMIDLYTQAYYLYDFLIAKFTINIVNFFTNYLIINKSSLCKALNIKLDANAEYSKKLFADPELATIHANISNILYNMGSFDIDFYNVLNLVYPGDQRIAAMIYQAFSDIGSVEGNFFTRYYYSIIKNDDTGPDLITAVKLQLQTTASQFVPVN